VLLGVASNSDAEVIAILLSYEANQIDGIVETILYGNPVSLALRGISSQGKQVTNAKGFRLKSKVISCIIIYYLVERLEHFFSSHISAGNVHQYIEA